MPTMSETFATEAVAAQLGLDHVGPNRQVGGVDSLDRASGDQLAFSVYEDATPIEESDAGAVICPSEIDPIDGETLVYATEPRRAFAEAAETFFAPEPPSGIHPTAVVEDGATIGTDCRIGPHAHVADCVTIGDGVTVRSGACLGGSGFGFVRESDESLRRLPHTGAVRIEDHVEIGANCTIDRAVFEETVVGRGSKLSGNVHLAHNVTIGADTTVACHTGIAGGAAVGDRVTVHPHVSVATDVRVGDDAELAMNAAVLEDVESGATVAGSPASPIR